jgi:hypothetical protein
VTSSGGTSSTPVWSQDCAPRNISNTPSPRRDQTMDITWDAPQSSCGTVDHFNLVGIDSTGASGQTLNIAPGSAFTGTASNLNRCTYYRIGVQAVYQGLHPAGPAGPGAPPPNSSPVAGPSHPVFMAGRADANPRIIVVLLQGVTSHDAGGTFNPATASYCTTPTGTEPPSNAQASLQGSATQWLNYNDDGTATPQSQSAGAGNNLVDTLASTGAWVLPFSYNGATLAGTTANPSLSILPYSAHDVGFDDPTMMQGKFESGTPMMPTTLQAEISSIHGFYRNTPILVVGHSNGGLIAEQWWLNFGRPGVLSGLPHKWRRGQWGDILLRTVPEQHMQRHPCLP